MTIRVVTRLALAIAVCVVGLACSDADTAALPAGGASSGTAGAGASADGVSSTLAASYGCYTGRNCLFGGTDCGKPDAPPHGTVRAPATRHGAIATYACMDGYDLVGAPSRICQADGTWSGAAPACSFAAAGSTCGSCGGAYDADGTCSISTPPNLGLPCDVGSGQGACTNGGTTGCGGICQPADPGIGDATDWHIVPAPNGSWDWDCDGAITMNFVATPAPPECSTYADTQSCNDAPTVEYATDTSPCGAQAILFKRDCNWMTLGPTCLDNPAGHRVVFQQCR